jgi:perosamine synthetase
MSSTKRYWHPERGYNFRMTNIQAAIGCAQLRRIEEIIQAKRRIFSIYSEALKGSSIILNRTRPWATNAYWLMTARIKGLSEVNRDELIVRLKDRGVDSRPFFYPMSSLPYLPDTKNTPVSYEIFKEGINLPTYVDLTEEDIQFVCQNLLSVLENL